MRWNVAVAALAAAWGWIAVIVAAVELGAAALAFYRLALAALALALGAALLGRMPLLRLPDRPLRLVVVGALLGVHWLLFFATIKLSSVAVAVLTVYTAPIFLALLAPLLLPERRSRVALVALVPAGAGLAAIALSGDTGAGATRLGVSVGLAAAVTYAGLVIATKRLAATLPTATILFWSYATAAALLAPLVPAGRVLPHGADVAYVLLLGVVFTALSGLVYVSLLRRVTAQAIGVLAYLEPVSAALLAWAVLGQPLEPAVVLGGALVVAAGVLVVLYEPSEATAVEAGPLRPLPSRAETE